MLNSTVLSIVIINFTIVTIILWAVTLLESYANTNLVTLDKYTIYECGFYSTSKQSVIITFNTLILLMFVLIYEVEYILLIPLIINLGLSNVNIMFIIKIILITIILTLILDFILNKVTWLY